MVPAVYTNILDTNSKILVYTKPIIPILEDFSSSGHGAMTVEPQATLLQNSLEGEAGPGGVGYATDAEPMEAILSFFLMALSHSSNNQG